MKKFTRTIEDFVCGHCGTVVKGTGYTNHCPKCLWSKHVDVNPGDRLNKCLGMMQPIAVDINQGQNIIIHKCEKCGAEKPNKTAAEDDFNAILTLAKSRQF